MKLGGIDFKRSIKSLLLIFLLSLPMGFVAYLICSLGNWTGTGNAIEKALLLGLAILTGLGVYLSGSYWMKNEELLFLLKMVWKKR
jgi:hypothetical protein